MSTFRDRFLSGGLLGQFFHFGPYADLGRGEQALWRERLDQRAYADAARAWRPGSVNLTDWVAQASAMGADYAVLTTRHHDSYCLWPTAEHTYHSVAGFDRDLVGEYVRACRAAGLRVGLYYSLADWTCPAYFNGRDADPAAFDAFIDGIFRQVRELLTGYGRIDIIWFDGCSPHDSHLWRSADLIAMIRELQPEIAINSRLGIDVKQGPEHVDGGIGPGDSDRYGDFSIGEGRVLSGLNRPWETCVTTTRKLWGYAAHEAWRTPEEIGEEFLRVLTSGGNYMINMGPDGDGRVPHGYRHLMAELAPWLQEVRPLLTGAEPLRGFTFVNRGWLFTRDQQIWAVLRTWDSSGMIPLTDLPTTPVSARLVGSGRRLTIHQDGDQCVIAGLPTQRPETLFPILELTFEHTPVIEAVSAKRNWKPELSAWQPFAPWAATGGAP